MKGKSKVMSKKMMGHNQPPLTIEDFYILNADGKSTGRIKITNIIIKKYLTRKTKIVKKNGEDASVYIERVVNDSKKIGLKAKISPGGTKSLFFQYTPKSQRMYFRYVFIAIIIFFHSKPFLQ